jgi:hypothetical protein
LTIVAVVVAFVSAEWLAPSEFAEAGTSSNRDAEQIHGRKQ